MVTPSLNFHQSFQYRSNHDVTDVPSCLIEIADGASLAAGGLRDEHARERANGLQVPQARGRRQRDADARPPETKDTEKLPMLAGGGGRPNAGG